MNVETANEGAWNDNQPTANEVVDRIMSFMNDVQVKPDTMIMPCRSFRYGPKHKTRRKRKKFHETWARLLKRPVREMRLVAMGRADLAGWKITPDPPLKFLGVVEGLKVHTAIGECLFEAGHGIVSIDKWEGGA